MIYEQYFATKYEYIIRPTTQIVFGTAVMKLLTRLTEGILLSATS